MKGNTFFSINHKSNSKFFSIKLFVLAQSILLINALLFDFLINKFGLASGFENETLFSSLNEKYLMVLLFAPLFETVVFNLLMNEFWNKFFNIITTIVLSSVLFAIFHFYSLYYMFFAFVGGLVFNSFYFHFRKNFNIYIAFLLTWLLHFNHNFIGIILDK